LERLGMSRKQIVLPPRRYFLLNKPAGCVSACKDAEHKTVMDCFPHEEREGLFPLGRLDKNTEGVLLITDDGKLNHRLLDPENHVEKEYLLWAAGTLGAGELEQLRCGVHLKGVPVPTRPAKVEVIKRATLAEIPEPLFENRVALAAEQPDMPAVQLRLWLTEGKRHQVKRMLEAVGCTVVWLRREAFAGIRIDEHLAPGAYRPLTDVELEGLL
jgi:16S rRNA pseudouridine516 synthase